MKGNKNNDASFQTYTGQEFNVFNIKLNAINIIDIAHSLSLSCRFNGHTRSHLSIAEHCYFTSTLCSPENALAGLLHDAAETYITDVPSPIKKFLSEFRNLDDRLTRAIFKRFGCTHPVPKEIKLLDRRLCYTEGFYNGMNVKRWDTQYDLMSNYKPQFWSAEQAETKYLNRYYEIAKTKNKKMC